MTSEVLCVWCNEPIQWHVGPQWSGWIRAEGPGSPAGRAICYFEEDPAGWPQRAVAHDSFVDGRMGRVLR